MNWFQNLSVRFKVLAIAGLGVLAFAGYFLYSYNVGTNIIRMGDASIDMGKGSIEKLTKIEEVDFTVLEATSQNNLILYTVRDALVRAIDFRDEEALGNAARLSEQAVQNLLDIAALDPTLQEDVDTLIGQFNAYNEAAQDLARQVISGDMDRIAFNNRLDTVERLRDEFEVYLEGFQEARYEEFYSNLNSAKESIVSTGESLVDTRENTASTQVIGMAIGGSALLLLALIAWWVTRSIVNPLNRAVEAAGSIANGDWETDIVVNSTNETGRLLEAIRRMRDALKATREEDRRQERLKTRLAELNDRLRGDMTLTQLGNNMLTYMVPVIEAQIGAFYGFDPDNEKLSLNSSYALQRRKNLANEFDLGESLVGQCALEKKQILLSQVPEDYISISSATGAATPRNVVVTPIIHEEELKGVLEIASFREFDDDDLAFLDQAVQVVAVSVHTAQSRVRLAEMLEQTKLQAQELEDQKEALGKVNTDLEEQAMELAASESRLQQQQEELRAINEELEAQTQALRASEESLQAQQEELRVTNEELEAQAKLLSEQKEEMAEKNRALEVLQKDLEENIRELELSSKYKSEFLSTMSHELRTPLNSILILSNALAQNKKNNLEPKQVEHAQVIHSAGSDLLGLINDILDISKIEEGKMDVIIDDIQTAELADHFRKHFAHIAENRGLYFKVDAAPDLPERIYTDRQRMEQVLKNLLSNAMKFTEDGGVTLRIDMPKEEEMPNRNLVPGETVRLSVIDTGIGIPEDKQKLIFEAFQQADGTTSRKYGGTGLGLTISRELSRLLGGDIGIHSDGPGQGSSFMLYLPVGAADQVHREEGEDSAAAAVAGASASATAAANQVFAAAASGGAAAPAEGGEENFVVREKTVLIIEDDAAFASVLVDLASDYGLEAQVCEDGESGLEYASHYRPSAIILDIGLPGMDGWEVMEQLKQDPRTKDIPVHFLSGKNEKKKALELGAIDFLTKPVSQNQMADAFTKIEKAIEKNVRRMLVVEDSELQHEGIRELFSEKGVEITPVHSGEEALEALKNQVYDCMILDLTLPDMNGLELLEIINGSDDYDSVPVIIYTGKELSREEEARLRKYADRIILKTERSSERLLNEASLFLHWLESTLPASAPASGEAMEHRDDVFEGKKLLLVDDDMRNIYALSAQLEELGFDITVANNGREAVDTINENPDMDIVLMDIMMPEMDGYEAMGLIREQERFKKLPMLALTAKAMKDDRAKCIEAGANDYCSKPIDMAKLTSLMRVWLHK